MYRLLTIYIIFILFFASLLVYMDATEKQKGVIRNADGQIICTFIFKDTTLNNNQ